MFLNPIRIDHLGRKLLGQDRNKVFSLQVGPAIKPGEQIVHLLVIGQLWPLIAHPPLQHSKRFHNQKCSHVNITVLVLPGLTWCARQTVTHVVTHFCSLEEVRLLVLITCMMCEGIQVRHLIPSSTTWLGVLILFSAFALNDTASSLLSSTGSTGGTVCFCHINRFTYALLLGIVDIKDKIFWKIKVRSSFNDICFPFTKIKKNVGIKSKILSE